MMTPLKARAKIFVTTELGGGGSASAESARIAKRGARNLLIHAGILTGEPEPGESRRLDMPGDDCFHFAECDGLFEITHDLGEEVEAGALIARIWPAERSGGAPAEVFAKRSGVIAARHFPGLIKAGDCLAVIAVSGDPHQ